MSLQMGIIIWIIAFSIADGFHIWSLIDSLGDWQYQKKRVPLDEEERRHIESRKILALGSIAQESLRIVVSSLMLYNGVVSLIAPFTNRATEWGFAGQLIIPFFIIVAVCMASKSIIQRVTRILAIRKIREGV